MNSPFFVEDYVKQERLNLYTVNMKYIRNLHNQGDDRVFSVSPQVGKSLRPFVGIVVICEKKQYCIPLSSPKDKHKTMKNGVDFHRILDTNGKLIGVLDFNNMIPVRDDILWKVDIKIHPRDGQEIKRYKKLMIDQLNFCRQNQSVLVKKAEKLYKMMGRKNSSGPLKRRCLKWNKLEQILDLYRKTTNE